ncbi:helix-turn-helix domain-containing protein [Microbacterium maritypicum]|uniref:helix-turn-helix domain-containing protein n=1 Tax=Microbacterium maritypicum TaxID=33918 RepID=UPI003D6F8C39
MSSVLPDDIAALRDALESSPEEVTVTLNLSRTSAAKVLELLEAEHSTGALVVPLKDLFTSTEAATMLGMSRPTLMKLVDAGEVEHVRVGSHRRIPLRAIVKSQRERSTERSEVEATAEEFRSNVTFRDNL